MKVFVSWSGSHSKNVALILRKYLRRMIQSLDVFVSDHDIAAGDRWEVRLADELEHADFGILCLSAESLHEDWLLFEAGALTKITEGRACGLLIGGLGHTDVTGPLSQFQNIKFERDGFRKLLDSINDLLKPPLDKEQLDTVFDACWPKIDAEYQEVLKPSDSGTSTQPERSERDLLEEMLTIVRGLPQGRKPMYPLEIVSRLASIQRQRSYRRLSGEDRSVLKELVEFNGMGKDGICELLALLNPDSVQRCIEAGLVQRDAAGKITIVDSD